VYSRKEANASGARVRRDPRAAFPRIRLVKAANETPVISAVRAPATVPAAILADAPDATLAAPTAAQPVMFPEIEFEHVYTVHLTNGRSIAPRFESAATAMPETGPNKTAAKRIGIIEMDACVSLVSQTRCLSEIAAATPRRRTAQTLPRP
jgi:hypothetical protein